MAFLKTRLRHNRNAAAAAGTACSDAAIVSAKQPENGDGVFQAAFALGFAGFQTASAALQKP